ncbi:MAG: hypothetical protein OXH75_15600 [Acidobacteria bacterium]|nr:hypothetical protein [Acidobacteriota bacterium]
MTPLPCARCRQPATQSLDTGNGFAFFCDDCEPADMTGSSVCPECSAPVKVLMVPGMVRCDSCGVMLRASIEARPLTPEDIDRLRRR